MAREIRYGFAVARLFLLKQSSTVTSIIVVTDADADAAAAATATAAALTLTGVISPLGLARSHCFQRCCC